MWNIFLDSENNTEKNTARRPRLRWKREARDWIQPGAQGAWLKWVHESAKRMLEFKLERKALGWKGREAHDWIQYGAQRACFKWAKTGARSAKTKHLFLNAKKAR